MSDLILPPALAPLLLAFRPCFQARSYLTFQWLLLGWVQCQGRRTVTEVALASGAVGERHISVFHRFFSRASWTLDALGHVVFGQAQNQAPQAVQRTAPFAGLVYSLVLLWAAAHQQQGGTLTWIVRPWYRAKSAVAFPDLLMALRQDLWRSRLSAPPLPARHPQNPPPVPHRSQPLAA